MTETIVSPPASHVDLLERGGLYARLYQRQFEPADELATTA